MHRRYALRAVAGLAAVICAAAVPATAYAAGTITITFAGNPSSNEPTVLQIDATATTPINSLTAELLTAPGGTDEYSVTDFTFASGTLTDGVWAATLPAGAVPAGTYTVSVTAGDTGGDTVTDADAGSFAFLDQPTLTASSNVSAVSYGSQSVTFSGQLTAVPAGGGTAIDEGGIPVYYETIGQSTGTFLADTASDGTFSATVPDLLGGEYTLVANATSTMAAAQSNQISISDNFASTSITATVTPQRAKYGAEVTLTGTATYEVAGTTTSQPLANYAVAITAGSTTLPAVQTNAYGVYTATVPTTDGSVFTVTTGAGNYLLDESSGTASLTVQLPVAVQSFSAKLEPLGTVQSTICLTSSATSAFGTPNLSSVELEYSARPHGPWKKLGYLESNFNTSSPKCTRARGEYLTDDWDASGEYVPTGVISGRLASAYYRVAFSGTANYQPFDSKAVRSSLNLTRLTGFSVSPRRVSSGGHVHVSGTLWEHGKTWKRYAHRMIGVFYYDAQGLYFVTTARTNSRGYFSTSIEFTGSGSAHMIAVYPGDKTHLWCGSNAIKFTVVAGSSAGETHLSVVGPNPARGLRIGTIIRELSLG
jgi:hypothetical protein